MEMLSKDRRIKLRAFRIGDEPSMLKFWGDEEVMSFCPGPLSTNETLKKSIEFYKKLYEEKSYTVFAVVLKTSGKVIGACGFNPTEQADTVELIYHLNKDYWHQGYGTEACEMAMELFHSLDHLSKINASVHIENHYSERILLSLGFKFTEKKWFSDSKAYENCYVYTT